MEIQDKIFVVALVLAIIFTGLAFFLFTLERKLNKVEKKISEMEAEREIVEEKMEK